MRFPTLARLAFRAGLALILVHHSAARVTQLPTLNGKQTIRALRSLILQVKFCTNIPQVPSFQPRPRAPRQASDSSSIPVCGIRTMILS